MAAPWAAGAVARIVGRLHGQDCINVFHFGTNAQGFDVQNPDALLLELAQALLDCALTTLLPAVTQDYTLVQCDAALIHPVKGDPVLATANAGAVGELGPTEVSFAASLMNIRTGGGGRRGRGKKFLPPPGEANITASSLDPATGALLVQFGLCLAGKFLENATTSWRLGVYSRTNDNAVNGTFDNSFRVATSFNFSTSMAVMRSRRVHFGA